MAIGEEKKKAIGTRDQAIGEEKKKAIGTRDQAIGEDSGNILRAVSSPSAYCQVPSLWS